ncbi:hypothetical protein FSP39_012655 [Pinctada imbricata]|uniref:Uncharacterized protein n=1 Tax=Pinctada imbricata TaxID=66713 RepID=A0AA88Y6U5_PINIB|nr:hypothetical protein FSP39_012655 [Pinctada imbricata]
MLYQQDTCSFYFQWCSMLQQFSVHAERLEKLDVTGTNFAHFILESREITQVSLSGVCTQDGHTLKIRCPKLKSLSIQKCDTLTDDIMQRIMGDCPDLSSITLTASSKTRCLTIPSSTTEYSLTAHRMLREIIPEYPIHVQHLTLNNLPKGCPRLSTFTLKIDKLSRLQVSHSSPLLNLQTMKLSISHIRHLSRVLGMVCILYMQVKGIASPSNISRILKIFFISVYSEHVQTVENFGHF